MRMLSVGGVYACGGARSVSRRLKLGGGGCVGHVMEGNRGSCLHIYDNQLYVLYSDCLPPLSPSFSFPPVVARALAFFDAGYRIFDPLLPTREGILHPVGVLTISSLNPTIIVQQKSR